MNDNETDEEADQETKSKRNPKQEKETSANSGDNYSRDVDRETELPAKYQDEDNKEQLKERMKKMVFEPGEAIGAVASQSISEPATQMTMETYHSAGAAKVSVTLGLPRLIEIINARKNPKNPNMNVCLTENDKELAKEVAKNIKELKFEELVKEDTLDLLDLEFKAVLSQEMLEEYDFDPSQVVSMLEKKLKKTEITLDEDKNELTLVPKQDNYDLRDLKNVKKKSFDTRLEGIKGIKNIVVMKDGDEWKIQTAGVNLRKVLKIDGVDETRTYSNDLYEIKRVLGIEAARNLILNEIEETLDEQGMNVDTRWITLIADVMTKEGNINGATRYGIMKQKESALARAAFEETKKQISQAAINGDKSRLNTVVENIMLGQVIPVGTGMLKLAPKAPSQQVVDRAEKTRQEREEKRRQRRQEKEEKINKIIGGSIKEAKQKLEEEDVDYEQLLEAEKESKNRKTLKNYLNQLIEESAGED